MNPRLNKELFLKTKKIITNKEIFELAKLSKSNFTRIINNNGNLKEIRR